MFTRLQINNKALYQQFKNRSLDGTYSVFNVTSGAHENVLSEAKLFANNANPVILFSDEHGNSIELNTESKYAILKYVKGSRRLFDLPSDYKTYNIVYRSEGVLDAADIDAMWSWKSAEEICVNLPGWKHGET